MYSLHSTDSIIEVQLVIRKYLLYKQNYHRHRHHHHHVSCHMPLLPGTSPLEPAVILIAQASIPDSSTFRIKCDVPSTAAFYSESIECVPAMASKFLFTPFVTIPVAPAITGIVIHLMFHFRCISVH
jgi:hypothetical protein